MQIKSVTNKEDLKKFIELPYYLYKDDFLWVPPLRVEVYGQFNPKRNPTLDHLQYELFLLYDDKTLIGRIAAFIDKIALDFWKEPIGFFGYYECINDLSASKILLETATDSLKRRGITIMRGPWTFVSQEWGLVLEGFTPSPTIMAPYNPPYYNEHMQLFGLVKVKDLLCYYISAKEGYKIPKRILSLTDEVSKRYNISVRKMDMKKYEQEVKNVIEISNISLIDNWGYTPVTNAEADAMAHDLKPVIHPKAVLFAEDKNGRPIGFIIAIPDINRILKNLRGNLFPFGWARLLFGIPRLHHYRIFALAVIPEYQGKGIDSLIYRALYESLYSEDIWLEINYVLEDNFPMNNAIRKLDAKPLRRYRIYQKEI
jgi:ribosomal protein S18 acetylase RimI-like enzyme